MRVLLSWSSGKDSAWALHTLRGDGIEVVGLLTTLNEEAARVSMQGVRRELLLAQAEALGLPVWEVPLPAPCPNEEYEQRMDNAIERAVSEGITHVAFGDLFLDDVRAYREEMLAPTGIEPLFPIWCGEKGTGDLAERMVASGVRAIITCVDPSQLDASFAGRSWDHTVLPAGVDPLGERGEFHTFCWAGPMFPTPTPLDRDRGSDRTRRLLVGRLDSGIISPTLFPAINAGSACRAAASRSADLSDIAPIRECS